VTPRIAVLGVGLIGGSIGLAARERLGAIVVGYDPDPGTREAALATGAADTATDSIAAACEGAEVVFCAAPVGLLAELVAAALAASGPDTAVTDVGSTKRGIVAVVGTDRRFIGGHPLAGAETAGVTNARADLFEGARWYLTPTPESDGVLYDRLQRAVAGLGARPQAIEAGQHDRLMATVSGMPHAVANALAAEAAGDLASGERVPEVGPSFRDATRVAGSNPAIWADIFASNREAIADSVEAVARRLDAAAALIRAGDTAAIGEWHAAAGEDRRRLLEAERPGGPLYELRIVVANRPGTMATLALALGEAGVNIEDMALYPAADMTSGAVSMWVAGEAQAERGAALVRELGHGVSIVDAGG
jgi:prephenate dehydrogenase